jgi:hypothetical protein
LKVREVCDDFIKRGNVYKLDGLEKFDSYFDDNVMAALLPLSGEDA